MTMPSKNVSNLDGQVLSDESQPNRPTESDWRQSSVTSPGQRLREVRVARGIDQLQVADELKLRLNQVDAIERDNWDQLPSAIYIIGYLRGYARFLGIEPKPLIDAFRQHQPDQPTLIPHTDQHTHQSKISHADDNLLQSLLGRFPTPNWITLGALSLLVVLGLLYLLTQTISVPDQPGDSSDQNEILDPIIKATPSLDADSQGSLNSHPLDSAVIEWMRLETPELDVPTDANDSVSRPTIPETTSFTEPTILDQNEPGWDANVDLNGSGTREISSEQMTGMVADAIEPEVPKPAAKQINLVFTGDCWVDVRDGNMNNLLLGAIKSGERHQITGPPPYSMVFGRPSSVNLSIDGEILDLAPYTQRGVARLTLTADDLNALAKPD